jgi:hypothetical protein
MFRMLSIFQRTHGHCDVPPTSRANSLYAWVEKQRARQQADNLPVEQEQRLRNLGVLFEEKAEARTSAGPPQQRWERKFAELLAFKQRFGHCDVPARWKENVPLGCWLHIQRAWKRRGILSSERVRRLEEIGVGWMRHGVRPSRPTTLHYRANEELWETRFQELCKWKDKAFQVPMGANEPLRRWINKQREAYRAGMLSPQRQQRLEQIGFPWEAPGQYDELWEQRFRQLLAFKEQFGHCNVPAKWKNNVVFGCWAHAQRAFKRRGQLSDERIRRLTEIGFEWNRGRGHHFPLTD